MKYDLKVAVIGSGYMGKQHVAVFKQIAKTVVLCSADEASGIALAEEHGCKFYADYMEMFQKEQPDCVSICLPTFLHYQATMNALECGIHVLCEKPFASDEKQAAEMVAKAKEKNLTLMVGHLVRFLKIYEYLRRCVADNRYGKLLWLNLFRHGTVPAWDAGSWMANVALSGGALVDLHIHDTDMIVNLLGMPKSVYTTGNLKLCSTAYQYGDDVTVTASGSWRPTKTTPWNAGFDAGFEKATVKYSTETHKEMTVFTPEGITNPLDTEDFSEFFPSNNGLENELNYFCHCVANQVEPVLCPPEDSLNTMILIGAETKSVTEHKEIVL